MKEKIQFRSVSEKDIPYLLTLRKITMDQHIVSAGLVPSEENHLARICYRLDCAHIVQYENKDVGLLKVVKEGDVWDLVQVQIDPSFQGKGIGCYLISDVLAHAHKHKVGVKLSVFKQNPAKKLYDRLGFEIVDETDTTYEMQTFIAKH